MRRDESGGETAHPGPAAAPRPRSSPFAVLRRHPRILLAVGLVLAFALAGTGAVWAGFSVGATSAEPEPSLEPDAGPPPRTVPASIPDPVGVRTCSIAGLAADPALGAFTGQVVVAGSGQILFDRAGTTPIAPGGAQAVLTAAVALHILGPTYQIDTRVVDGAEEGTVVLVGRGDPTLSRLLEDQESYYASAPRLSALAEQVVRSYAEEHPDDPIRRLELDSSYWATGDRWDASWDRAQQTGGTLAEVTALQVDGDRDDPTLAVSPRSTGPIARAGDAFAEALKAADPDEVVIDEGIEIVEAVAPPNAPLLGEVKSQRLSQLLPRMLADGDTALAESLARIASKESGADGSAASLTAVYTSALTAMGIPLPGLVVRDGSGASAANAIPTAQLAQLMARIHAGGRGLGVVRDALPLAGQSGTLAARFEGDAADAEGQVRAIPGPLAGSTTLAGMVDASDGTQLAFAFSGVQGGVTPAAAAALDALAAAVFRCGSNLAQN